MQDGDATVNVHRSCVALLGNIIEEIAAKGTEFVTDVSKNNRQKRDGGSHHLTLLTPDEWKKLTADQTRNVL